MRDKLRSMHEGYCNKCKTRRALADAVEETMKNGRKAVKGRCPECGAVMFKIIGGKAALNAAGVSMEEVCREVLGDAFESGDCEAIAAANAACAEEAAEVDVAEQGNDFDGEISASRDPRGTEDLEKRNEPKNATS